MGDFIKIFLVLGAMVGAFFVGKGYGEKTFLASDEYKDIAKTREDLDYAKNELENAKAKLQNIVDRSDNKKTDEILSQILQVFLADLGLQIQNKDKLIEQAKLCNKTEPTKPVEAVSSVPKVDMTRAAVEKLKREDEKEQKAAEKFRLNEENLLKDASNGAALKDLDKVVLKNLANGQLDDVIEKIQCEQYLGDYRGPVVAVTNENIGSMQFKLSAKTIPEGTLYLGNISWIYNDIAIPGAIANGCGHKLNNLEGRVFMMENGRFVQLYKLPRLSKIAGNLYEVLPNQHYSKRVGKFILSRTDKF